MVSVVVILLLGPMLDRKSWHLVLPTVLVGGLGLLLLPPTFAERAESILTLADRGSGRLNIWLVGLQIIRAHPLLGVGWGSFGRAFDRYLAQTAGLRGYIVSGWGPHNVFLGALGELGVIGLILFSAMIGLTVKDAFSAVQGFRERNDSRMACLSIGVLLGLVGILTASMFVDLRYRKIFWLALVLAEATKRLSSEPKEMH
jgi:O-antigen ligase